MYVQIFNTKDKELMTAVMEAVKLKFPNCLFTLSALDGKPLKLNLEGAEDEREKVIYANAFAKEFKKQQAALAIAATQANPSENKK